MSCTALPSDEAEMNVLYHKIERLDNDLKKREMHLAELIDEVVYAEDNKDKAVRRAEAARYLVNQLENVVQDLLGYLKVLEGNVLLPAFLDLASVVPQDPVVNREVIDETLQKISEDSLTSRTKKLISAVRELPSKTKNRAAREAFMRNVAEESVNVEDTIVLSGLLLEKKDELTALLDDLRDRVRAMLQGNHSELVAGVRSRSVSAGGNISPDYDELREQLRRVTNERDDLQRLASKSENSASIIRVLQEDRKEMEEQLSKAHQQLLKEELKSRRLREQVETLEQSVEQQKHEKELLQGEIKELKREQVNWSRSCAEERRVDEEVQQLRAELDKLVSEHSA
ncbi:hypothetical protein DQ04_08701020, partial [Trypanosoma grayi]|uniref:hypothetical protein n=1 Tax=Trypanosoma grayi TaxID=71804 RepID=UPI0004F474F3